MDRMANQTLHPLARMALRLPAHAGLWLSLAARVAGVGAALVIVGSQDHEGSRVFAGAVTVLGLASLPLRPAWTTRSLPWLGAGVLFFAGALLASMTAGTLLIFAGGIGALGAAIEDRQQDRQTGALWFFVGFGIIAVLVAMTVLAIEG
jgi:ABC-type transport system involved in cytochrome c biogenesis permease subunit